MCIVVFLASLKWSPVSCRGYNLDLCGICLCGVSFVVYFLVVTFYYCSLDPYLSRESHALCIFTDTQFDVE